MPMRLKLACIRSPIHSFLLKKKKDRIRGRRKGGREIEEKEEEEKESIRNTFIPFYDTAFFFR